MERFNLNFRQVHLDFHTSPDIDGIADEFDPEEFASVLDKARVDSITCFARCHHGMLYYDSKLFPERVHPHLKNKNLLKEQIEACHKRGIRVPIYITVQWDKFTADAHPEWLAVDERGNPIGNAINEPGFYRTLCVNSPYRDFLKDLTGEILTTLPVDGLFFDIVGTVDCSCRYCRAGMIKEGLDIYQYEDRIKYANKMISGFMQDMTDFIRKFNQSASIFYNRGHVGPFNRRIASAYTHFELESLPSGFWGYMHYPVTQRYARNLGLDTMGMTGKFHTEWGDFHSFKNLHALEYECFRMLALNAKCSIGDQLEPNGRLSQPVYDLIGKVYSSVEKKEPWCKNAYALTDIGVFTPEEFEKVGTNSLLPSITGAARMLEQAGMQFDVIDTKSDFSKYKVLIMPDNITVNDEFEEKLSNYLQNGGSVIASYESGLDEDKTAFNFKELGVKCIGPAPYSPDFIVPEGEVGAGLPKTEHVMYLKGVEVSAQSAEVLSWTKIPYFNRTKEHFCSHRHTPSSGKVGYPGITKCGNVIYFMHPIFTQYDKNAPLWCKKLFLNAINMLLPEPLVTHGGPSTMVVTLNRQDAEDRLVLHALHYIPERRSKEIDIIEDIIPLYNVKFSVKVETIKEIHDVKCVPQNKPLKFEISNGRVEFILPELYGHQMIEIK